jgi:NhaA family Na+:H+ antiporter
MKGTNGAEPALASSSEASALPPRLVDELLSPLHRFLRIEAAGGCVLIACAAIALILANSPLAAWYASLWETPVTIAVGSYRHSHPLGQFLVNDLLMTMFFFVIGLEIKREIAFGELSDPRKAALPVFAAIGGMVVPAAVYCLFPTGEAGSRGWAIPMATDIAFVVGVLALMGNRAPMGLKVFLLTLAIADDVGAILVIAAAYTESVSGAWLGVAAAGVAATLVLARIGVRSITPYVVAGAPVWIGLFEAGVHPTVAGVILGLITPARPWIDQQALEATLEAARGARVGDSGESDAVLNAARFAAREATSPLHRLEAGLHPWVAFVVMPLFALANAGVPLEVSSAINPVAVAVAAGLALGKPLGVLLFVWLLLRSGVASLPEGVEWRHVVAGACLAGIGFTMALFLNELAFPTDKYPTQDAAGKIGILLGSLGSAVIGVTILLRAPASADMSRS